MLNYACSQVNTLEVTLFITLTFWENGRLRNRYDECPRCGTMKFHVIDSEDFLDDKVCLDNTDVFICENGHTFNEPVRR